MLIFGHAGITLGTAVLLNGILTRSYSLSRQDKADDCLEPGARAVSAQNRFTLSAASWLTSLASRIDIRLLLVASLLPDIIDRPVGQLLFRDTFSSGRIFCHTLLFSILISLIGLYIYRSRGKLWLLVLSFGTFAHLIFDQMWLAPKTLLWPLYGFAFEKTDITGWMPRLLHALLTDPEVYVPELVGLVLLIWFAWLVVRQGKLFAFIRNGEIR